jgi:FkbM family methyltransferase
VTNIASILAKDSFSTEEIGLVRQDVMDKVFAIQSLIGQRSRWQELLKFIATQSAVAGADGIRNIATLALKTHSQFFQEAFALAVAKGKRNGFFVEFGACDGLHLSNSYFLEKELGWSGVLSEPARVWGDDLRANRAVAIDVRCVSNKSGAHINFTEAANPGESTSAKQTPTGDSISYQVETITLGDLLTAHNAPEFIDFISIDTEGTEFEILQDFDFDLYRFGFISVEVHVNDDRITALLDKAGYEILFPRQPGLSIWSQITGFDTWYVPKATRAALMG